MEGFCLGGGWVSACARTGCVGCGKRERLERGMRRTSCGMAFVDFFWPRASAVEVVLADMVVLFTMFEGEPISIPCLGIDGCFEK